MRLIEIATTMLIQRFASWLRTAAELKVAHASIVATSQ